MGRLMVFRLIAAFIATVSLSAGAATTTFTGSSGSLSASVSFEILSGGQLRVILANTSTSDVLVPTDVLTGLFFNMAGNPTLTRISAISGGTTFLNGASVSPVGTVVGGEWAYEASLAEYGANSGISSSGLGLFGPPDLFPGSNLSGPTSPAGLQYGLTSAGDNVATGNAAVMGNELTKNSVTILLASLPTGFSLSSISNVTFQYGTALDEGHITVGGGGIKTVPEPSTLLLSGLALVSLSIVRRRRS